MDKWRVYWTATVIPQSWVFTGNYQTSVQTGPFGCPYETAVIGMRQRGGDTVAMPIARNDGDTILGEINKAVSKGSRVMTDDHRSYSGLADMEFKHESVNHTQDEYVRGNVHTNSIESVWAVMKRGMHGVYHHASKKHLGRYVDEFTFRLNAGKVQRHTFDRLDSFVDNVVGRRITYAQLTADAA